MERWKRGDQPCAGHPFSSPRAPKRQGGPRESSRRRPERTGATAAVAARAIKHSAACAAGDDVVSLRGGGGHCYILAPRGGHVARRDAAQSKWEACGSGSGGGPARAADGLWRCKRRRKQLRRFGSVGPGADLALAVSQRQLRSATPRAAVDRSIPGCQTPPACSARQAASHEGRGRTAAPC